MWLATIDIDLGHLAKVVTVRCFHCYCALQFHTVRKSLVGVHTEGKEGCASSLWGQNIYIIIQNSSAREICLYSSIYVFIQSIMYLNQYGLIGIYFLLWVLIQYYCVYFVVQLVPALVTGNSFCWFLWPLDIAPIGIGFYCCYLFILVLPHFLALQDVPDSKQTNEQNKAPFHNCLPPHTHKKNPRKQVWGWVLND